MAYAGKKASKLAGRGVRRVFAIDVVRQRVVEWSQAMGTWLVLAPGTTIADPALAVELPVDALLADGSPDDAVARALITKRNPVIVAALHARGHAEALVTVLEARGIALLNEQHSRILAEQEPSRLATWLRRAATCVTAAELLGD